MYNVHIFKCPLKRLPGWLSGQVCLILTPSLSVELILCHLGMQQQRTAQTDGRGHDEDNKDDTTTMKILNETDSLKTKRLKSV